MKHDPLHRHVSLALIMTTVLAAGLFQLRPGVDLAVSRLFYVPGHGFPLADSPTAIVLRDIARLIFDVASLACLMMLAWTAAHRSRGLQVPARVWGFAAAGLALGPGLLANVVLKEYWGRARPDAVTAFGGEHAFTAPLTVSDACAHNCAFVSGEAAMIATLAMLLGVLLAGSPTPRRRIAAGVLLGIIVAVTSGLRIAMGRHYLSDVVFAVLFCALILAALYPLFRVRPVRSRITLAALGQDLLVPPAAVIGWVVRRPLGRLVRFRLGRLRRRFLRPGGRPDAT